VSVQIIQGSVTLTNNTQNGTGVIYIPYSVWKGNFYIPQLSYLVYTPQYAPFINFAFGTPTATPDYFGAIQLPYTYSLANINVSLLEGFYVTYSGDPAPTITAYNPTL